ncbi:MAG: hypothetical protein K0S67_463 [Nitrososphaeraceae archaeon]|jgi:hypothetical protein|nr:hypothetical protein [Nitrososphaeraceae archaeon]MCD6036579.1 hypothetical protein [Nitrososphaeraceae archaeon]MDF2767264.1 hypothetical protein [Nitrososphaeraceae archaeon]
MTNRILYYAAAATTAIAGILHLSLVPDIIGRNLNSGVFFLISGIAQIFWVIPMLKRWGRTWYYIGIAGTIILIIMWVMTRIPGNPITGRGGPISEMAVAIEVFQVAYIIITAIIIAKESRSSISQTIKDERLNR